MSYSKIKTLLQSGMPREVIAAGLACGIPAEKIEDAYFGEYSSDESFAREFAENIGAMQDSSSWPYTCIDWEQAANELMFDFSSDNGHYFSNNY